MSLKDDREQYEREMYLKVSNHELQPVLWQSTRAIKQKY
jgi:hypothetical protein